MLHVFKSFSIQFTHNAVDDYFFTDLNEHARLSLNRHSYFACRVNQNKSLKLIDQKQDSIISCKSSAELADMILTTVN